MGLFFTDSCDNYGSTSDLARIWLGGVGSAWTYAAGAGRNGGGALQGGSGAVSALASPVGGWSYANAVKASYGFWCKISAAPAARSQLFADGTASTTGNGSNVNCISVETTGKISSYYNTLTGITGFANICDNNWHWIEWQSTGQGGGGSLLYVDRTLQGVNVSTGVNVVRSQVQFCNMAGVTVTVDDLVCYNDTAPGLVSANYPIGPQTITVTRPTSDQSVQFTPNSGLTNYTQVDDVGPDGDSSYVQGQTSGQTDLYGYGSIGYTPTTINGVMLLTLTRNPGPGSISFKNRCSSGGTVSDSAAIAVSGSPSYTAARTAFDQDPHTSAAWIRANLDVALFGYTIP